MIETYFFDSYAFFEFIAKNPSYERFTQVQFVTTKLNLFELYYGLLQENQEELALFLLKKYFPYALDFDLDVVMYAARFRFLQKKRKLSMTDCIGYTFAQKLGIPFLTGDKEFEHMDNVVFVSKFKKT